MWKIYDSFIEANVQFISYRGQKEQQNNESGKQRLWKTYKMESPHVDTYIKREEGALKI